MSLKVSLIAASKSEDVLETWLGGQERRTKATFGSVRHERSSVVSNWESLMLCKASREAFTFAILLLNTASQKTGGPMGQPRRENPWRVTGISDGRGEQDALASPGI